MKIDIAGEGPLYSNTDFSVLTFIGAHFHGFWLWCGFWFWLGLRLRIINRFVDDFDWLRVCRSNRFWLLAATGTLAKK